jgi:hypothetical protein
MTPSLCSFIYFTVLGFETQGLELLRQGLYHSTHASSPFALVYFSDGVLHFFPGWPWTNILLSPPP